MFDQVHEGNWELFAAKFYDNPQCFDIVEFYEDLSRFKYLKRLFNKYKESGELRERLIINHLVVLYNVFGVTPTNRLLFLKLRGYESLLKPFLIFLGYMPEEVKGLGLDNYTIRNSEIEFDQRILEELNKL